LICKAFGIDNQENIHEVFTPSAFNKLWELTGGNAPITKKILDKVYDKYYKGELGACITDMDIISGADSFVMKLFEDAVNGEVSAFNPLLVENDEDEEKNLNDAIMKYLTEVAIETKMKNGICKRTAVEHKKTYLRIGETEKKTLYEILVDRDVLLPDKENVKVKVGVLLVYLYKKYELENSQKKKGGQ